MDLEKFSSIRKEIKSKCIYYRGRIINEMIILEEEIDILISDFLSGNNENRLIEIMDILSINEGITLHTKCKTLGYILKQYYPDFLKEFPNFLSEFEYLIKVRNYVAHKKLNDENDAITSYDGKSIYLKWTSTSRGKRKDSIFELNDEIVDDITNRIAEQFMTAIHLTNYIYDNLE